MKHSKESLVEGTMPSGERIEGRVTHLRPNDAVFETFGQAPDLRTSTAFSSLKITVEGRVVYEGRGTVTQIIDSRESMQCQVLLGGDGLHTSALPAGSPEEFDRFLASWLAPFKLTAEFKLAVADFELMLLKLRSWLNQVEVRLRAPGGDTAEERVNDLLLRIAPRIIAAIRSQHERFEELFESLDQEQRSAHQQYAWQKLGGHFLSTPFGHRTYHKPLGYAGDFEMMNMIHRNRPEGDSLFSRMLHLLLVQQWPAESVRQRISHLKQMLVNETARVARSGRRARIMNLGCGPGREIQGFIEEQAISERADFTLIDFDEGALEHAGGRLRNLAALHGRRTGIETRKASVQQLLRQALMRRGSAGEKFDVIYCAGLFDYLSDATCKALVHLFAESLEPDGLVVVANMNNSKPFRHFIESILDWHLVYRDSHRMKSWHPHPPARGVTIITEPTTVNLFLHLRKNEA